jgi:hypothetical protein
MPKWVHDRAERLRKKNPDMEEGTSYAIATQQSYAAGKAPKKWKGQTFGTRKGKRNALSKYDRPKKEYQKTASGDRSAASKVGVGAAAGGGIGYLLSKALKLPPFLTLPTTIGGAGVGGALATPKPGATYGVHQGFKMAEMNALEKFAMDQELDLDALEEEARAALKPFVVRKLDEDNGSTSVAAGFPSYGKVPILGIHVAEHANPYAVGGGAAGGAMLGSIAGKLSKSRALSRFLQGVGAAGGGAAGGFGAGRMFREDPDVDIAAGEVDAATALRHPALLGLGKQAELELLEKEASERLNTVQLSLKKLKPPKGLTQKAGDRTPSWGGTTKPPPTNMAGEVKGIAPPPVV